MARLTGSDTLFKLIHSLSVEEKGYFIKFAKRQRSDGGQVLELFNAIRNQQEFEEKSLSKKFNNYANRKAYLKEMITDCLLLYYRNNHPHIQLFNQIQKTQVLVLKGLHGEALKIVDKSLELAEKMELFQLELYLMRMRFELHKHQFVKWSDRRSTAEAHLAHSKKLLAKEEDLLNFEWNAEDSFSRFVEADKLFGYDPLPVEQEIKEMELKVALSLRGEIKKKSALNWLYFLKGDTNAGVNICDEQLQLENKLKKYHDSSFNIVPTTSNRIINLLDTRQPLLAEKMSRKMIANEVKDKFYYDFAFTRGIICIAESCYYTGNFQKGVNELEKNGAELIEAFKRIGETRKLRRYYCLKIILLFAAREYKEAWFRLNESISLLKKVEVNVPDILLLQMMIQLEFENFGLLAGMAANAEKKLKQKGINTYDFIVLLQLFKTVTPKNIQPLATAALNDLKNYHRQQQSRGPMLFGNLKYEHWLETKSSGKRLEELVKEE